MGILNEMAAEKAKNERAQQLENLLVEAISGIVEEDEGREGAMDREFLDRIIQRAVARVIKERTA
jgi:hypothetical protein